MAYAPFNLSGKVALVTGGNRGIGLGMARAMAQAGADIVIWGSNPERNLAAEQQLTTLGVRVKAQTVDVSDEDACVAALDLVVDELGHVDSCFANAAVDGPYAGLLDTSLADFRAVTAVDLDAVFVTLREAARHMVARGKGGSLVATSSIGARIGTIVSGAPEKVSVRRLPAIGFSCVSRRTTETAPMCSGTSDSSLENRTRISRPATATRRS